MFSAKISVERISVSKQCFTHLHTITHLFHLLLLRLNIGKIKMRKENGNESGGMNLKENTQLL